MCEWHDVVAHREGLKGLRELCVALLGRVLVAHHHGNGCVRMVLEPEAKRGYWQGTRGLPSATEVDAGRAVSNPSISSPRSVSGGDVQILGPSRVFSRRRVARSRRKPLERVISPTSSRSTLQLGVDSPLIVDKGRIDSGRRRIPLMAGTLSTRTQ